MQLKQVIRILVFSGFLWHGLVACSATVQPFARLSMPTGVATDTTGNVFVTSDALLTTLVTKFNSAGQALGSIPIGGITVAILAVWLWIRVGGTVGPFVGRRGAPYQPKNRSGAAACGFALHAG